MVDSMCMEHVRFITVCGSSSHALHVVTFGTLCKASSWNEGSFILLL